MVIVLRRPPCEGSAMVLSTPIIGLLRFTSGPLANARPPCWVRVSIAEKRNEKQIEVDEKEGRGCVVCAMN